MRLLQSTTLELTEFLDTELPPYAILSHTWEKDEVTYQEMRVLTSRTKQKAGFMKIKRAADLAKTKGFEYVWVDTCCIDKSSSAELTEAINSMFKWYKQSGVCFAFLSDVSLDLDFNSNSNSNSNSRRRGQPLGPLLSSSRWITRGWTLQELIAPGTILFYGSNSTYLGNKHSLKGVLHEITGISWEVLTSCDPSRASVAERMSWASERETTRVEDMAYCLMGIFDVNMPLLYGEGDRAFIRLQEEILRSSDDHSLFAWRASHNSRYSYRGLLARSPEEFRGEHTFDFASPSQLYDDQPFSVTNKGIQMTVPLVPWSKARHAGSANGRSPGREKEVLERNAFEDENFFVAILNCDDGIGIVLLRLADKNQYARVDADLFWYLKPGEFKFETIFVRQKIRLSRNHHSSRLFAIDVSYADLIALNSEEIAVTSDNKSLVFNENATNNVYELRSLNGLDEKSKDLTFLLKSHDKRTHESYMGFNNWTAAVKVVMKWDSQTGTYCFQALYSPGEILDRESPIASCVEWDYTEQLELHVGNKSKRESKWKSLIIPMSGQGSFQLEFDTYTILREDRPVIVVEIWNNVVRSDG